MGNVSDSTAGGRQPRLLTVGHSTHDLEHFLKLVEGAGVTAVADVRSHPHSRRQPHFNGPELAAALRSRGMVYIFLGASLGGRPDDPELYDEGRVDYERVRATEAFRQGTTGYVDDWAAHFQPLGFDLDDVAAPTRLLAAREDRQVPPGHVHWFAERLPDASLTWFDGGHLDPHDAEELAALAWAARGDEASAP